MKAAKSEGLGLWTQRGGGLEAFSSTPPQSSRGCQGRASGEEGDKVASAERSAITKEEQQSYQEERSSKRPWRRRFQAQDRPERTQA